MSHEKCHQKYEKWKIGLTQIKLTGVAGGLGEIRSGGSVHCAVCCSVCSVQCAVVSASCWGRTTNDHLHSHTEWRHTISNEECFFDICNCIVDRLNILTNQFWTSIIKVFVFLHRMTSQGLFPPLDTIASRWTWAAVAKFGHFLDICRTL